MGMIKRALKRTSRKILAKIVPPAQSHQLVLNPATLQATELLASSQDAQGKRKLAASLQKKLRRSSKDNTVAEALLLAVKNHLPPVQFHHVHGPNVQLSKSKCVARRTHSFCQALVFSNRVIFPNERVYIKVLEIAKGWSGTIRFGFTAVDPATLACRMPKHACPDMTSAGHTWARALADEVVRRNSVIHFSYNKNGLIHYGINNQDCGVFHANVSTNQNLWFIVDIYGLTAAVELFDPRTSARMDGPGANNLDLSGSTMYKSTSAMSEIFGQYTATGSALGPASRSGSRKKHSRKHARHAALAMHGAGGTAAGWAFQNSLGASNFLGLSYDPQTQQYTPTGMQLPNLNSMNLPSAQQNIYSPMPRDMAATGDASHDYHQIMNNSACQAGGNNLYQPIGGRADARLVPSVSVANISNMPTLASAVSSSFSCSSGDVNSSTSTHAHSRLAHDHHHHHNDDDDEHHDLSRRLENLRVHERRSRASQPASRTPRSTSLAARTPVAAARRQSDSTQTNLKRTPDRGADIAIVSQRGASASAAGNHGNQRSKMSAAALLAQTSSGGAVKPKSNRHVSARNQKSAASDRDKNNNSPPSKDCPICFERPINCVLYQCGHMCTCYECGVKQWKTESRTCPICRTIIKDVIKTYMS